MSTVQGTYYAIQQVSTGLFLPAGGKGLGGHTRQVPTDTRPPRLFMKRRYAVRAMQMWCEGQYYERSYASYFGESDVEFGVTKVAGRSLADMQVVALTLEFAQ